MKTIVAIVFAVSLAGCAHGPPLSAKPQVQQHHVKKTAPVVKPPVAVAPPVAPPVVTPQPSPQQTFKHRWLRLFFRDRALSQ